MRVIRLLLVARTVSTSHGLSCRFICIRPALLFHFFAVYIAHRPFPPYLPINSSSSIKHEHGPQSFAATTPWNHIPSLVSLCRVARVRSTPSRVVAQSPSWLDLTCLRYRCKVANDACLGLDSWVLAFQPTRPRSSCASPPSVDNSCPLLAWTKV